MQGQTKVCRTCERTLSLSEFESSTPRGGTRNTCRACRRARERARRRTGEHAYFARLVSRLHNKRRTTHQWSITVDDVMGLWRSQGGKCAITSAPMTRTVGGGRVLTNPSIDRIDSTRGYVLENVQLVCCVVNTMKGLLDQDTFIEWCQRVGTNQPHPHH